MKTREKKPENVVRGSEAICSVTFCTQSTVVEVYNVTKILPTANISKHVFQNSIQVSSLHLTFWSLLCKMLCTSGGKKHSPRKLGVVKIQE